MCGVGQADVERRRAVVEPGGFTQEGRPAIALGKSDRLPRSIEGGGVAVFVSAAPRVCGVGQADIERRRAVVEPGALAQDGRTAKALGNSDRLTRSIESDGVA